MGCRLPTVNSGRTVRCRLRWLLNNTDPETLSVHTILLEYVHPRSQEASIVLTQKGAGACNVFRLLKLYASDENQVILGLPSDRYTTTRSQWESCAEG